MKLNKNKKNIYSSIFSTEKKVVMGILNITNDSFFDGGRYTNDEQIIRQTKKMLDEGATIIAGCCRTRPSHIKHMVQNLVN